MATDTKYLKNIRRLLLKPGNDLKKVRDYKTASSYFLILKIEENVLYIYTYALEVSVVKTGPIRILRLYLSMISTLEVTVLFSHCLCYMHLYPCIISALVSSFLM